MTRGNIVVRTTGPDLYLYTHWGGYALDDILKRALKRGEDRWNDDQYLARIIFCEMVKEDIDGTMGYGVGTELGDNEYDLLICDTVTRTVYRERVVAHRAGERDATVYQSFAAYIVSREENNE